MADGPVTTGVHAEPEHSDLEWILRAKAGDHAAYAGLVRRYQDKVHRFLWRMVGSSDEALDLTQDTFIKAWQALPEWQPQAAFHTWLYRIASNAAIDALRRRRLVDFTAFDEGTDMPDPKAGPEARLHAKQRLQALDAALTRLPGDQRAVVLLREVEGLGYEEIAAALEVNVGTVKSRLARARTALGAQLRKNDP